MRVDTNNNSIYIRALNINDVKELYIMLNDLDEKSKNFFHPHPFNIKSIEEIVNSEEDHYFVMFYNKKLIGYTFLRLFGFDVPSFGIVIRRGFTGRGYGTYLTKWMMNKAKEIGYKKVILKTYKENLPAKKIYEKIGFLIVGITENNKQYKMEFNLK